MMTEGEGGLPIQDPWCSKAIFGQGIGYHMGRCVDGATFQLKRLGKDWRFTQGIRLQSSIRPWKVNCSIHWRNE